MPGFAPTSDAARAPQFLHILTWPFQTKVSGQPPRMVDLRPIQDILADGGRQRLAAPFDGLVVGLDAAVKRLAEGPHPLRHGLVADPHLAQIVVHVLAEAVEQRLGKGGVGARPAQLRQHHPQVQHHHIETAVNRVRYAQRLIKQRFSRLRHDHAIDGLNGAARGQPGFPEVVELPKHFRALQRAPCVRANLCYDRPAVHCANSRRGPVLRGQDPFCND